MPATSADWIIEAKALGRRFETQQAIAGVDLCVRRGEIFGVLGPDGAGKTTLMQMLAAILDPSEGACRVLGFDTVSEADKVTERIGYMAQGFTLYDRLSVDENLAFAARIRAVGDDDFKCRRARLLDMAGLARFAARRAGHLSGGMRKKLSLCTNLIHEPPLLLLDELSLGVDPRSRRELWQILRQFRASGTTIVLTTPYMDEAEHCDRLAFLHQGRLLAIDTPGALRALASGQVFEIKTQTPDAAYKALAHSPAVAGIQWLADSLRFQIMVGGKLPATVRSELARLGSLSEASPVLENAFIHLARQPAAAQAPEPMPAISASAEGPSIAAQDVSVRFGNFTAVDCVSFTAAPGEVIGWLGPNGAGKTTLIKVLCGLLRPANGNIGIAGVDVIRRPFQLRQLIGYMSQRFSLYPDLTVHENLRFFAGAYGLAGNMRSEAMAWAVRMTGLAGVEERRAGEISAALRQRLTLACAVMHRPMVLFLDEPTSVVDPLARQRFWQLIRSLAATGMTVFVTTHYLEEARYCHRLGLMMDGRLIALGSIAELRAGLGDAAICESMEDIFMAYLERAQADAMRMEAA